MVELTGRFEMLAAEASELQLPRHQNLGRIALLRQETHAVLCLIEAMLVLRQSGQFRRPDVNTSAFFPVNQRNARCGSQRYCRPSRLETVAEFGVKTLPCRNRRRGSTAQARYVWEFRCRQCYLFSIWRLRGGARGIRTDFDIIGNYGDFFGMP